MKEKEDTNGIYLNDFHKKWNEACMRENERVAALKPFSVEFLRAQSQRMDALVKAEEERLKNERKKQKK